MPLLDQFGNPLPLKGKSNRRPKNRRPTRRVPRNATEVARRNLAPVTNVEMILAARHNINGVQYGPGRVVVPIDVSKGLAEGERNAARTDQNFASTRGVVIGPGRSKGALSVTEVAPEYFDINPMLGVPFGVVNRNTGMFSPA